MNETIDIFASLRTKSTLSRRGGKHGERNKLFVEFTAPDLVFRVDDDLVAKTTCEAIALTMRTNMLAGKDSAGRPLPRVSAATEERREYRAEQFKRGGNAFDFAELQATHEKQVYRKNRKTGIRELVTVERKMKIHSTAFPNAKKNFRKRFRAPNVPGQSAQGVHEPSAPLMPRSRIGVESGLMARSIAAGKERPGVWGVYFANVRAITDESGKSAVQRVYERIGVWSREAMKQPLIQEALKQTAQSIVVRKRKESLKAFGRALSQTTKSAIGLAGDLADLGL